MEPRKSAEGLNEEEYHQLLNDQKFRKLFRQLYKEEVEVEAGMADENKKQGKSRVGVTKEKRVSEGVLLSTKETSKEKETVKSPSDTTLYTPAL